MEIGLFSGNTGAIVVAAMWGLYVIGDKAWRDTMERRKQGSVDQAAGSLVKQLSTALDAANKLVESERERNEGLSKQLLSLSEELGQLRSDFRHSDEERTKLRGEVNVLTKTVEQLVVENRNKDHSITELVALNRKLLKSIGCANPISDE